MDNRKIELIKNYIETIYKPSEIYINFKKFDKSDETYIHVGFDSIGDEYITNQYYYDPRKLKERNLEYEIRKDIKSFFDVETSGLSLSGFAPYKRLGLTIDVYSNERN